MERMDWMFYEATSFNRILEIEHGECAGYEVYVFKATSFNQDIGGWQTGNVQNMHTFFKATSFNQSIGGWETGKVTDMSGMFHEATSFDQDIGGWQTGNVTDMSYMFWNAHSFNRKVDNWRLDSIAGWTGTCPSGGMERMFGCASRFTQNISAWVRGFADADREACEGELGEKLVVRLDDYSYNQYVSCIRGEGRRKRREGCRDEQTYSVQYKKKSRFDGMITCIDMGDNPAFDELWEKKVFHVQRRRRSVLELPDWFGKVVSLQDLFEWEEEDANVTSKGK